MNNIKLLLAVKDQHILETLEQEKDIEIVGDTQNMREALALARKRKPDILLLDSKNIYEDCAFENINALYPNVRFIIISDEIQDNSEVLFESVAAGANGYISKNVSSEELLDNIRLVKEGGCVLNPKLVPVFLDKFRELTNNTKKKPGLSEEEKNIMKLVINGMNERDIARRLGTSRRKVKTFIRDIMKKLSVKNLTQAVIVVLKRRLVEV